MILTPRFSKVVLTSHITFSIGWLGAIAVFLALAITGLTNQDIQMARAAYLAMELSGWSVIVPFCLASLLTGLIQALGTRWGLIKHYWIVVKLVLTLAATILLLLHMKPISYIASVAAQTPFSTNMLPNLRVQLIADAGAAFLLLLVITTVSVYKPWGRIHSGRWDDIGRKREVPVSAIDPKTSLKFYVLVGIVFLVLFIILKHLIGGGMGGH
ncbi:hypothetical protein [Spirosoma areae]